MVHHAARISVCVFMFASVKIKSVKTAAQRLSPYRLLISGPLELNEWQMDHLGEGRLLRLFEESDSKWVHSDGVCSFLRRIGSGGRRAPKITSFTAGEWTPTETGK